MLAVQTWGEPGNAPPVLIAHGLYGSARNWGAIAKRIADQREVRVPDMRNHGASPWFDDHDYHAMAGDLAHVADRPMDVVGHSMGGKAAMALALTEPDRVRKLVVADIAPVAYSHSQIQFIHAMRAIDLDRIETRGDAGRQLKDHVDDPGIRAFLLQSLDVRERRWRLNLDALAAEMETITGWPDLPGTFEGPTLFLSGGESDYVKRAHRDDIRAQFPNARFASIPGAGHWLHAEKPREFLAALDVFLNA